MSSDSFNEQRDITALLDTMEELSRVKTIAIWKGDGLAELDAALAGLPSDGKPGGCCIAVLAPEEGPEQENASFPIIKRVHTIHITELKALNRNAPGQANPDMCGLLAEDIKDLVFQRLHARSLGRASLQWIGSTDFMDEMNGSGYDVKFRIIGALGTEARHAVPTVSQSSGTVTITGNAADGEVIYYTRDGNTPTPGTSTNPTTATEYGEPFTAESGELVRIAAIATGKAISEITQIRID